MKVYEDGAVVAEVLENGAAVGHVAVKPQKQVSYLENLSEEEVVQLFYCASFAATTIFEGLGAQGTNIIINEGDGELTVNVLPRFADDGLDFFWEPKRADQAELEANAGKIKDKLWYVGKEEAPQQAPTQAAPKKAESSVPEKDNYKIKQLTRKL